MSINKYVFFSDRLFSILLFCRWVSFTYLLIFSSFANSQTIYFSGSYLELFKQCVNDYDFSIAGGPPKAKTSISKFVNGDYSHTDYVRRGESCAGFNYDMFTLKVVVPYTYYQNSFIIGEFPTEEDRFKAFCEKAKTYFFAYDGSYEFAPNGVYSNHTLYTTDKYLYWGLNDGAFVSPFFNTVLPENTVDLSHSKDTLKTYVVECQSNSLTPLLYQLYSFDYAITACTDEVLTEKYNDSINEYFSVFNTAFDDFIVDDISRGQTIEDNCSIVMQTCRDDLLTPIFSKISWLFPLLSSLYAFLMVFSHD